MDIESIRATFGAIGGGVTIEIERAARITRDVRTTARREEVGQMLREEESTRAAARAELEQIRAEIVRVRGDAETQTRIVKELEVEKRAIMTRAAEEDVARARAEGVARAEEATRARAIEEEASRARGGRVKRTRADQPTAIMDSIRDRGE